MCYSLKNEFFSLLRKGFILSTILFVGFSDLSANINWQTLNNISSNKGNSAGLQVCSYKDGGGVAVWSWFNGANYVIQSSLMKSPGQWSSPVTISNPTSDAFFPQIGVDSKGNAFAVWSQKKNGVFVVFSASKPYKKSWKDPVVVSTIDNGGDAILPQIAFNQKGKAHLVWQKKYGQVSVIEYSAKNESSGTQSLWSTPKRLSDFSTHGIGCIEPKLAINPKGDLYVIWNNASKQAVEGVSEISNKNWGKIEVISNPGLKVSQPQIYCDNDGNAIAGWSCFDGNNWTVQSSSKPFKNRWSSPATLSSIGQDSSNPCFVVDSDGNAVAAWQTMESGFSIIQTAFLPFGEEWSLPFSITSADQDASEPQMTVDSFNNETLVWKRSNGTNFVIQASSGFLGESWSNPVTLSKNGQDAVSPQVAVDSFGNPIVVWMRSNGSRTISQACFGVYFE